MDVNRDPFFHFTLPLISWVCSFHILSSSPIYLLFPYLFSPWSKTSSFLTQTTERPATCIFISFCGPNDLAKFKEDHVTPLCHKLQSKIHASESELLWPFPCLKVKLLSHIQLFVTPWTVACQAPPSMGFSRQEYWSELPFPSPGDLPNPGIEPGSPTLQADSTVWATRETSLVCIVLTSCYSLSFILYVFNKSHLLEVPARVMSYCFSPSPFKLCSCFPLNMKCLSPTPLCSEHLLIAQDCTPLRTHS